MYSPLSDNSPFTAVGLLDDDPRKRHVRLRHLQVAGGRDALGALAERVKATMLIVAVPSATSELIRELSGLAVDCGLDVRVLPPVEELLVVSKVSLSDIRPVTEADLLGRHQIDTEVELISGYLSGRRVLVTGAGGSIGSELCRQIARFEPAELVMLDHDDRVFTACNCRSKVALCSPRVRWWCATSETSSALRRSLPSTGQRSYSTPRLSSTCHCLRCGRPRPSRRTSSALRMCWMRPKPSARKFVNISTDKAADPCSVLGLHQASGERITAASAASTRGTYLSVRFGNVLGSRGSVVTTFRAQVKAGGPITVTHPDVTRYFMTVEEAVQLVIQAGAVGRSGEVLVLDMGNPVRINEVAERLASEATETVEIVYTGLRPGEKLHESLFGIGEVDDRPVHPLISHVRVPPLDDDEYERLKETTDATELKVLLRAACEVVRPNGTEMVTLGPQSSTSPASRFTNDELNTLDA